MRPPSPLSHLRLILLLLPACIALAWSGSAHSRGDTHEYTLANGLRLIVRENPRAPVVVLQVWYRVGASDEPPGGTGMSHVLEHMMFKATEHLDSGQLSELVTDAGGRHNAFTNSDCTGYYEELSSNNLALAMQLEAERMTRLRFDPDEFERELEVVKEERRLRIDDNPDALFGERFRAVAYAASPYGRPVIGWMHDLDRLDLTRTRDWYRRWYQPDNAIVVVAGDIDPQAVLQLAQRHFGPLPASGIGDRQQPLEVAAAGTRSLEAELRVELPRLVMAWNVPSVTTAARQDDAWALRMLAGVLDAGYSARIESELVRGSEVALQAGAGYTPFSRGDTLFQVSGIPNLARGETLDSLQQAFEAQIGRLQQELATAAELQRVKAQVIAGLVYHQDSLQAQASMIGSLECEGMRWSLADEQIAALEAVSAEQIRAAARRYLQPERLTVGRLRPLAEAND